MPWMSTFDKTPCSNSNSPVLKHWITTIFLACSAMAHSSIIVPFTDKNCVPVYLPLPERTGTAVFPISREKDGKAHFTTMARPGCLPAWPKHMPSILPVRKKASKLYATPNPSRSSVRSIMAPRSANSFLSATCDGFSVRIRPYRSWGFPASNGSRWSTTIQGGLPSLWKIARIPSLRESRFGTIIFGRCISVAHIRHGAARSTSRKTISSVSKPG